MNADYLALTLRIDRETLIFVSRTSMRKSSIILCKMLIMGLYESYIIFSSGDKL